MKLKDWLSLKLKKDIEFMIHIIDQKGYYLDFRLEIGILNADFKNIKNLDRFGELEIKGWFIGYDQKLHIFVQDELTKDEEVDIYQAYCVAHRKESYWKKVYSFGYEQIFCFLCESEFSELKEDNFKWFNA